MDPTLAFVSAAYGIPHAQTRAFVSGARPVSAPKVSRRPCAFIVRATAAGEAPPAGETPADAPAAAVAATPADPVETQAGSDPVTSGDDASNDGEPKAENKRRNRRVGGNRPKREVTLKLEDMSPGQEIEGVVKSTTAYGAFVGDMGTPTDGLLHVSQLTNGFVENVTDIVNVGDKVKVRVLAIDLEKGNFSLTMKPPMTAEEEAAAAERRSGGGQRGGGGGGGGGAASKWKDFTFDPEVFIDVKVISVTGFGAFCKLLDAEGNEDEKAPTDGLIHISALSDDHVSDVSSILSVGQVVKARVTDTDRKRNRISLSLRQSKQVESDTYAEDLEASRSKQPEFKTSMELAFERANMKV